MVKGKKAICPVEAGLKAMLKGDMNGFDSLPKDIKDRLTTLADDIYPSGDGEVETESSSPDVRLARLSSLVDVLGVRITAVPNMYRGAVKALRKGIEKEINGLKKQIP
jgi:hypothetical protein